MSENESCPKCGKEDPERVHEQIVSANVSIWHCMSELIKPSPKEPRSRRV